MLLIPIRSKYDLIFCSNYKYVKSCLYRLLTHAYGRGGEEVVLGGGGKAPGVFWEDARLKPLPGRGRELGREERSAG